jgi:uncharacterized protein (DUF2267 family)
MNAADHARLVHAVQTNCHIADARHAADLTLCNYLLQMREFFRWERGLPFDAALPRAEVGEWIATREALWEAHEQRAFEPLPLTAEGHDGPEPLDPFAVDAINEHLAPFGLLYGAGLVGGRRPVFFLAQRHAEGRRDGLRVQQAGREWARGLAAPPAALAGGDDGPIVLRRESLARIAWERYEAFRLRPVAGSAFAAVVQAYGFDAGFEAALPRWLDDHTEVALLHELGEHRAATLLGPRWSALRQALPTRRAELLATALRDQLADLAVTLPTLLERDAEPSLHAWFAAYDGLREALFPDLVTAYRCWREGDGGRRLQHAVAAGHDHFIALATQLLALQARDGDAAGTAIAQQLDSPAAVCRLAAQRPPG